MSAELSFMSAARLSIDSNRSPAMPAGDQRHAERCDRQRPSRPARDTGPAKYRKIGAATKPPIAPSMVFFGLSAAPADAARAVARVVLRRVADGDRRHQQQHRAAAAEHVDADQRAQRQAEVDMANAPAARPSSQPASDSAPAGDAMTVVRRRVQRRHRAIAIDDDADADHRLARHVGKRHDRDRGQRRRQRRQPRNPRTERAHQLRILLKRQHADSERDDQQDGRVAEPDDGKEDDRQARRR